MAVPGLLSGIRGLRVRPPPAATKFQAAAGVDIAGCPLATHESALTHVYAGSATSGNFKTRRLRAKDLSGAGTFPVHYSSDCDE